MGEIKKLIKSFVYAFEGFKFCLRSERNLRIHVSMIYYVLFFSAILKITALEVVLLVLCFGLVVSCELLNTAIELICDKEKAGFNYFIKRAKDIAAAAVFSTAVTAIIVGLIVFVPKVPQLLAILNIYYILFIAISLPISYIFIFKRR